MTGYLMLYMPSHIIQSYIMTPYYDKYHLQYNSVPTSDEELRSSCDTINDGILQQIMAHWSIFLNLMVVHGHTPTD